MAYDWDGDWDTDYGEMTLEVNGANLSGSYELHGGTIQGTVAGNIASGLWKQHISDLGGERWGRFCIIMDDDGDFEGGWSYGNKIGPPWDGTWEGTPDE
jgi:hypothetical protein